MRYGTMAYIAAGGIASALFGATVADAAPTAPDAAEVRDRLEAHGFHVFVHGNEDGPLDRCTVSAVRPGQTFEWMGLDVPSPRDGLGSTTIVTGMTIHLDVTC